MLERLVVGVHPMNACRYVSWTSSEQNQLNEVNADLIKPRMNSNVRQSIPRTDVLTYRMRDTSVIVRPVIYAFGEFLHDVTRNLAERLLRSIYKEFRWEDTDFQRFLSFPWRLPMTSNSNRRSRTCSWLNSIHTLCTALGLSDSSQAQVRCGINSASELHRVQRLSLKGLRAAHLLVLRNLATLKRRHYLVSRVADGHATISLMARRAFRNANSSRITLNFKFGYNSRDGCSSAEALNRAVPSSSFQRVQHESISWFHPRSNKNSLFRNTIRRIEGDLIRTQSGRQPGLPV